MNSQGIFNLSPNDLNAIIDCSNKSIPYYLYRFSCSKITGLQPGNFIYRNQSIILSSEINWLNSPRLLEDIELNYKDTIGSKVTIKNTYNTLLLSIAFLFFFVLHNYILFKSLNHIFKTRKHKNNSHILIYNNLKWGCKFFPLGKYYLRRAESLIICNDISHLGTSEVINHNEVNVTNLNLEVGGVCSSQQYSLYLTSKERDINHPSKHYLFKKFAKGLKELGAIDSVEIFIKSITGSSEEKVNWYFKTQTLIFMIDFLKLNKIIDFRHRSILIKDHFYNKVSKKGYVSQNLNKMASRQGLSNLDKKSIGILIGESAETEFFKVYDLYERIYL